MDYLKYENGTWKVPGGVSIEQTAWNAIYFFVNMHDEEILLVITPKENGGKIYHEDCNYREHYIKGACDNFITTINPTDTHNTLFMNKEEKEFIKFALHHAGQWRKHYG